MSAERYHESEIGAILGDCFSSHGLPVNLRDNDLTQATLQALALHGIRKPLLMSKERFIVVSVLSNPEIYRVVSPAIELVASVEGEDFWWYGTGKIKQREFMNQLQEYFGIESMDDDAFMEINVQPCFPQLRPFLEWRSRDTQAVDFEDNTRWRPR